LVHEMPFQLIYHSMMESLFQPEYNNCILNISEFRQTALAAPVDDGIIFCAAPRPPRQS
jgi:hypothetical protein